MSIPTPNDNFNRKRKILASAMDRRPNSTLDGGFLKRRPAETPYTRTAKSKLSNGGSVRATPVDQLILHAGLRAEFKKMSLGTFIDVVQSFSKFFFFVSRDRPELLRSINQGLEATPRRGVQQELQHNSDSLLIGQSDSEEESIEDTLEEDEDEGMPEDHYNNGLTPSDYSNLGH